MAAPTGGYETNLDTVLGQNSVRVMRRVKVNPFQAGTAAATSGALVSTGKQYPR